MGLILSVVGFANFLLNYLPYMISVLLKLESLQMNMYSIFNNFQNQNYVGFDPYLIDYVDVWGSQIQAQRF